jgi:hypothetical protein
MHQKARDDPEGDRMNTAGQYIELGGAVLQFLTALLGARRLRRWRRRTRGVSAARKV